jgi:hypothetical protein
VWEQFATYASLWLPIRHGAVIHPSSYTLLDTLLERYILYPKPCVSLTMYFIEIVLHGDAFIHPFKRLAFEACTIG